MFPEAGRFPATQPTHLHAIASALVKAGSLANRLSITELTNAAQFGLVPIPPLLSMLQSPARVLDTRAAGLTPLEQYTIEHRFLNGHKMPARRIRVVGGRWSASTSFKAWLCDCPGPHKPDKIAILTGHVYTRRGFHDCFQNNE